MLTLSEITQTVIDTKAREVYPTQSNASVKRWWYDPIGAIMNHAYSLDWCSYRRFKKPKITRKPPEWAEREWFEAFWPECNENLLVITTLLPYTGMRITEALELEWSRVSLEERWAYIPKTKNREPRTVSLPPIVCDALKSIQKDRGRVFPWNDHRAVNTAIRRTVARVNRKREDDGLPPIKYMSTHKLGSHTWGTWMMRYANMNPRTLVGTGRWKDMRSTMVYTHTTVKEESKKSDLLPEIKKCANIVHEGDK